MNHLPLIPILAVIWLVYALLHKNSSRLLSELFERVSRRRQSTSRGKSLDSKFILAKILETRHTYARRVIREKARTTLRGYGSFTHGKFRWDKVASYTGTHRGINSEARVETGARSLLPNVLEPAKVQHREKRRKSPDGRTAKKGLVDSRDHESAKTP